MQIVKPAAPIEPRFSTGGMRLAHAPMPGVRRVLCDVLGAQLTNAASFVPMAAHRIPEALAEREADAGVWWDAEPPTELAGSVIAMASLIVVSNQAANLPSRALTPSDLSDIAMVGFSGLGQHLMTEFLHRMAVADAKLRLGKPHELAHESDQPMFSLVPGSRETGDLGHAMSILPLAEPLKAQLVLAHALDGPTETEGRPFAAA